MGNHLMPEGGEIQLGERRIAFTVARSRRRRRTIAFVMENASTLKIMAPMRASLSSIHSVLHGHTGWIKRRLAEFQKRPAASATQSYKDGGQVTYLGHIYILSVTHDKNRPQGCTLRPHRMDVNLHAQGISVKDTEQEIRLEILLWLKKRARVKLQQRMDLWAERLGVTYRKMVVANAERRWGSCNAQNVIRLNWRLMMAPLPILDYVVVHELCHVRHKNHGQNFWQQVASALPDYKNRRKHLHFIGGGLVL
jgi:predicted metal-dependent hydrolase